MIEGDTTAEIATLMILTWTVFCQDIIDLIDLGQEKDGILVKEGVMQMTLMIIWTG